MKRGGEGSVVSKPCKAHLGNVSRCPQGKFDDVGESHTLLWAEADGAAKGPDLLWAAGDGTAEDKPEPE